MAVYKGIMMFPTLFTAKKVKDASGQGTGDAKFSAALLFRAGDPQIAQIQAIVDKAVAESFPSGFPTKGDKCFGPYDDKFRGKEYYDPKLSGCYVLTTTAREDDKPSVVGMDRQPLMDANKACAGAVVYMNAGISAYTKGTGGVGGWLNGVMATEEDMPFGRLDGKPSIEQMFADVGGDPATGGAAGAPPPAPDAPPPPPAPDAPPPPPPPAPDAPQFVMTAKANGVTRAKFLENPAWSDELLIQHGYMLPPNGVTPSFV